MCRRNIYYQNNKDRDKNEEAQLSENELVRDTGFGLKHLEYDLLPRAGIKDKNSACLSNKRRKLNKTKLSLLNRLQSFVASPFNR